MKIGIIGKGVVGGAVYDGLQALGHKLSYYDKKDTETKIENVLDTEIIFVCVPTNSKIDGTCDISIVQEVTQELDNLNYTGIIAIKSTVIPGTTEQLIQKYPTSRICFVPEFLREKSALSDFIEKHDLLIVGTYDNVVYDIIVESHGDLPMNRVKVPPTEAELVKYFSNVYNSLRVTFANGIFEVCEKLGADYQKVFNASILRSTISPEYLRCSEYFRGYEGHCLPKDSQAFALLVKQLGLEHISIFDSIVNDNTYHVKVKK